MEKPAEADTEASAPRPRRADARRNVDALLKAAKSVFEVSGVDAPAKQVTDLAGVGVGTLYRHFPQRSDLIVAVLHREIDACADTASELDVARDPARALALWLERYTTLLATKQGLAQALHSDAPAFEALRGHLIQKLEPALQSLLDVATRTGVVRADVSATDLLRAVALLSLPIADEGPEYGRRMIAVFIDGLRLEEHPSTRR